MFRVVILAVLFAAPAVLGADELERTFRFKVFRGSKFSAADAAVQCENDGGALADLGNLCKLNLLRSLIGSYPFTTEFWISGTTNSNHHAIIQDAQLEAASSGNNCRILSNHRVNNGNTYNIYAKECGGKRYYICQY